MKSIILAVLLILTPLIADATSTEYWVATTGSDSNSCAQATNSSTPKLTIPAGVSCLSGGDTLTIKAGTYQKASGTTFISNPPSGTDAQYTIIQGDPTGAKPVLKGTSPTGTSGTLGLVLNTVSQGAGNARHHIKIIGLEFTDLLSAVDLVGTDAAGFPYNVHILRNYFHHFGRYAMSCSASTTGTPVMNHLIQGNEFSHMGYYRPGYIPGENTIYSPGNGSIVEYNVVHDVTNGFGVWKSGSIQKNVTIRYNLFYNIGRLDINTWAQGSGINFDSTAIYVAVPGGGHKIHNNVIYNCGSVTYAHGCKAFFFGTQTNNTSTVELYNNTVYNILQPTGGYAVWADAARMSSTTIQCKNFIAYLAQNGFTNCTQAGNQTTDPSFVNAGAGNFALGAGSTAINTGVDVGLPFNSSAPDKGALETSTYASATVNENFLDVTIGMNLNTPILPASGLTGFTALVGGVARTTLSANKLAGTDSVVRIQFDGAACTGGQTWTVTYATGNATDSALIGGTLNQSVLGFADQAVTNNCGSAPPSDPGTPHIYLPLDDGTSGTTPTTAEDSSANNLDGTLINGPTWVTGKHGSGVSFADQGDDAITVSYGNAENPLTTSHTFCMGVLPVSTSTTRTYFGAPLGTNQSLYLSKISGTWSMGIQSSAASSNTQFPVSAGWTYICLVMDKDTPGSGTGTATLYVNGVAGTTASAQSVKTYTSYALAGNFTFGHGNGFFDSVSGGVTLDEIKVYRSALTGANILDLYNAWEPPSAPPPCTTAQAGHQFRLLRQSAGHTVVSHGAANATVNVIAGGALILDIQTDCSANGPSSIAHRARYNLAGGSFVSEIPDVMGPDGIAFYGSAAQSDPDILTGAVACCLTGALTAIDGTTQVTAAAVPVVPFTTGSSTVLRYIFRFDASAAGKTFCVKSYNQTGSPMDSYVPSGGACINVVPMSAGVGF